MSFTETCISTEDLSLYSSFKTIESSKEMDYDLHRGLVLIFLIRVYGISEDMKQHLHGGPLLTFLTRSVSNQ
jgi:hypothetical protein